ncbi:MAG: exonuclease SbcCD subunit D, partial [Saprospiraceae bacterium]
MRVLHFSDTHLGYQAFDVVNAQGINAREQDVYDAFERVVDRALELRPDVVIHAGDFFHRPSPSNRALTFGLEQLRRICDAHIPVVVIGGNHETPKTIYNSPILRAFRSLDCVHPFFSDQWEYFENEHLAIHGVPHINDRRLLFGELERLQPVPGKYNILLLHTSLGKRYLMDEYGEQIFPPEFEDKLSGFDYIALGHWHNHQQIGLHPNAWYAGSTERLSDTEIGAEKGFILLDINGKDCTLHFEPIPTRPWWKLELNDCHQKTLAEITVELTVFRDTHDIRNAIISLNINDIKVEQSLELSNAKLKDLFPGSFQILAKRRTEGDRSFVRSIEANQFDSLDKIFAEYLRSKYADAEPLAEQLVARAGEYFQR